MPDVSLGRAVLDLVTDPTKLRAGMSAARAETLAAVQSAQRALTTAGAQMSRTGQQLSLGITLPVLAAGRAIVDMGAAFDTTLRQIVGLTDVTEAQIGGIKDEVLALGAEVGKAPQELAEAFYFVASAGFEAEEAMEVLRTAATASAAGLGKTQDIAKVLGLTLNAYGKENISAARAADILVAAVKDGTAEADAFAGVLGRVVPTAATLGVSFDQVAGSLAAMTLTGLSADEAATSLNQVLVSLLKPTVEANGAMEAMGLSAQGLRDQLREQGLLATLRTLEERFAGNDEAASQVFGNVRALRGVLALLTLDSDQLNDVMADTAGALGDLAEGYEATEGPARDMARSQAELDASLLLLSEDVLPIVADLLHDVAGAVRDVARWFKDLPPDVRENTVRMLALLAALGPVLFILGSMVTAVAGLWGGLSTLATVVFTRTIPAIVGLELSVGRVHLALAPLLPILAFLGYELNKINEMKANPGGAWAEVQEDTQWALDHPFIPSWFRGIAEALGLVAVEAPGAAAGLSTVSDATRAAMADLDNFPGKVEDDLAPIGPAFADAAAEGPEAYAARQAEALTTAIEDQKAYTADALDVLQTFRREIESAYKAAQDAALDAERTAVAIATKQAELAALDKERTENMGKWTKAQTREWRLRRAEAEAELSALRLHAALIGDDIAKTAGLKGLLASKEMKEGLTSEFPETVAAYEALRAEAIAELNRIATRGGPAARDAAAAVAKYLNPNSPSSPLRNADNWGWRTGREWISNLSAAIGNGLYGTGGVYWSVQKVAQVLKATSPPGPASPLHEIDRWGDRTGRAWVDPLVAVLGSAVARIRAPLEAVGAVMSRPYGTPGLSLAAAGAGVGIGSAARSAPAFPMEGDAPAAGRTNIYQLTVQGDLVARDKTDVLDTIKRMDAISKDDD